MFSVVWITLSGMYGVMLSIVYSLPAAWVLLAEEEATTIAEVSKIFLFASDKNLRCKTCSSF